MRCCKDLMLRWACELLRKEMSRPNECCAKIAFLLIFFLQIVKNRQSNHELERYFYNEICHIFSVVFPVVFLSSLQYPSSVFYQSLHVVIFFFNFAVTPLPLDVSDSVLNDLS